MKTVNNKQGDNVWPKKLTDVKSCAQKLLQQKTLRLSHNHIVLHQERVDRCLCQFSNTLLCTVVGNCYVSILYRMWF